MNTPSCESCLKCSPGTCPELANFEPTKEELFMVMGAREVILAARMLGRMTEAIEITKAIMTWAKDTNTPVTTILIASYLLMLSISKTVANELTKSIRSTMN